MQRRSVFRTLALSLASMFAVIAALSALQQYSHADWTIYGCQDYTIPAPPPLLPGTCMRVRYACSVGDHWSRDDCVFVMGLTVDQLCVCTLVCFTPVTNQVYEYFTFLADPVITFVPCENDQIP